MNRNKHIIHRFFNSPFESKLKAIIIFFILIKVQLIVWVLPLRYYYNRYFSRTEPSQPERQLFNKHLSHFIKVRKVLPLKFSCLVESMARYDYLKRYGIVNPVRIGIRINSDLDAHAWNDHQNVLNFKSII